MYWMCTIHIVVPEDDSKDKEQGTEDVGRQSNPVLSQGTPLVSAEYEHISM